MSGEEAAEISPPPLRQFGAVEAKAAWLHGAVLPRGVAAGFGAVRPLIARWVESRLSARPRRDAVAHRQVAPATRSEEETRPDDGYAAPVAPVSRPSGRRFPRSGWIALVLLVVAAGSFLAGTQVGSSTRVPAPTPGAPARALVGTVPPLSATAPPSALSPTPTTPAAVPPAASSLSLDHALTAARAAFLGSSPQIAAAQVVRYGDVSRSSLASPDTWVWVFTARGTFSFASCGGPTASPSPCPSPAATARVIVDYRTGAFIEAEVPGTP